MAHSRTTLSSPDAIATALRRVVPHGRVATSGPSYEAAGTLWNGRPDRSPAAVLMCAEVSDVQAGVRIAGELGIPLSVRAGGHGWTGAAVADGGLTLDLRPMRKVTVDADRSQARVQGGATAGELIAAARPYGLLAATGTVDSVGMAGLSLGGGYGPLSGKFGLAVDNVEAVELVLADGTHLTADAAREPELFWALRGGGGNFGVVTALHVRLHAVPSLLTGMIMFPWRQAPAVLAALEETLLQGPDELTVQCGMVTGPAGDSVLFVAPTWCGAAAEGERVLAGLATLGTALHARTEAADLGEMLAQTGAMFPVGRHVEIRPRTLARLTPGAIEAISAAGAAATSPYSAISLHSLHGAAARVPADATAFTTRDPHLLAENIAVWEPDDPQPESHRDWARDLSAALAPESLPGGYTNLLAADEADQIAHAYGPHRDRLLAVKRHFDPGGLFQATPLPRLVRAR